MAAACRFSPAARSRWRPLRVEIVVRIVGVPAHAGELVAGALARERQGVLHQSAAGVLGGQVGSVVDAGRQVELVGGSKDVFQHLVQVRPHVGS